MYRLVASSHPSSGFFLEHASRVARGKTHPIKIDFLVRDELLLTCDIHHGMLSYPRRLALGCSVYKQTHLASCRGWEQGQISIWFR